LADCNARRRTPLNQFSLFHKFGIFIDARRNFSPRQPSGTLRSISFNLPESPPQRTLSVLVQSLASAMALSLGLERLTSPRMRQTGQPKALSGPILLLSECHLQHCAISPQMFSDSPHGAAGSGPTFAKFSLEQA
jgi:hypothetical protein